MIMKVFLVCCILLITGVAFSQDVELVRLKYTSTPTSAGGSTSVYYFIKNFNQKSVTDWETIKKNILEVLAENKKVNQLTIYFLNKEVYDFRKYPRNSSGHSVPDTEDLYALTIGNKSNADSDTRCSFTVVMNIAEPEPGYLSNLCFPGNGAVAQE